MNEQHPTCRVNSTRSWRTYRTSEIVVAFARENVPIDAISRALAISYEWVKDICARADLDPPETRKDNRPRSAEVARLRRDLTKAETRIKRLTTGARKNRPLLVGVFGLSEKEAEVADLLMRHDRVSREMLYANLYGSRDSKDAPDPKLLDCFIHKIRRKLPKGCEIQTIWGWGWSMSAATKDAVRNAAR